MAPLLGQHPVPIPGGSLPPGRSSCFPSGAWAMPYLTWSWRARGLPTCWTLTTPILLPIGPVGASGILSASSGQTPVAAVVQPVSPAQVLARGVRTLSGLLAPPEHFGLSACIMSWGFSAPCLRSLWACPASAFRAYPLGGLRVGYCRAEATRVLGPLISFLVRGASRAHPGGGVSVEAAVRAGNAAG